MEEKYACILLAAGQSKRFGSQKMHFSLDGKQTMLQQSLSIYFDFFDSVCVVAQQGDVFLEEQLRSMDLKASVNLVTVKEPTLGMSESIRQGIVANQGMDGWLIALGDMPLISKQTIASLVDHFGSSRLAAPFYADHEGGVKQGHPVFFGSDFYHQLMDIRGDQGAKEVIENNKQFLRKVMVSDIGVITDFDRKPMQD